MVLIQSRTTHSRPLPVLDAREAMNNVFDAVLGFLDVWEDAIDPASWPPGWEVCYSERPRSPSG